MLSLAQTHHNTNGVSKMGRAHCKPGEARQDGNGGDDGSARFINASVPRQVFVEHLREESPIASACTAQGSREKACAMKQNVCGGECVCAYR